MAAYNTEIYAAFCGTGKTYLCDQLGLKCIEFECWKYRTGDFPDNYIKEIKSQIGRVDYIFISTDPVVLKTLYAQGINVKLVYPNLGLKKEYRQRFLDRGSPIEFIKMINKPWRQWITELQEQKYCEQIVLNKGEYLENILYEQITTTEKES
jgi:hypothetical protein